MAILPLSSGDAINAYRSAPGDAGRIHLTHDGLEVVALFSAAEGTALGHLAQASGYASPSWVLVISGGTLTAGPGTLELVDADGQAVTVQVTGGEMAHMGELLLQ